MKKILALVAITSSVYANAEPTDYKFDHCSGIVGNSSMGNRGPSSADDSNPVLRMGSENGMWNVDYVPFDIDPKTGDIKPHNDITKLDRKRDGNNVITTIKYKQPDSLQSVSSDGPRNPYTQNLREVQFKIVKNNKGELLSISSDRMLTADEMKKAIRVQNGDTSPEMQEFKKKLSQIDPDFPSSYKFAKGSTIEFETKDGKCFPSSSYDRFAVQDEDGEGFRESTQPIFNTKLCRGLKDFYEKNEAASACLGDELNGEVAEIIMKNSKHVNGGGGLSSSMLNNPEGLEVNGKQIYRGIGVFDRPNQTRFNRGHMMAMGYHFDQMRDEDRAIGKEPASVARARSGEHPIVAGKAMLQECYDHGLENVLADDSLFSSGSAPSNRSSNGDVIDR